MYNFVVNVMSL